MAQIDECDRIKFDVTRGEKTISYYIVLSEFMKTYFSTIERIFECCKRNNNGMKSYFTFDSPSELEFSFDVLNYDEKFFRSVLSEDGSIVSLFNKNVIKFICYFGGQKYLSSVKDKYNKLLNRNNLINDQWKSFVKSIDRCNQSDGKIYIECVSGNSDEFKIKFYKYEESVDLIENSIEYTPKEILSVGSHSSKTPSSEFEYIDEKEEYPTEVSLQVSPESDEKLMDSETISAKFSAPMLSEKSNIDIRIDLGNEMVGQAYVENNVVKRTKYVWYVTFIFNDDQSNSKIIRFEQADLKIFNVLIKQGNVKRTFAIKRE